MPAQRVQPPGTYCVISSSTGVRSFDSGASLPHAPRVSLSLWEWVWIFMIQNTFQTLQVGLSARCVPAWVCLFPKGNLINLKCILSRRIFMIRGRFLTLPVGLSAWHFPAGARWSPKRLHLIILRQGFQQCKHPGFQSM